MFMELDLIIFIIGCAVLFVFAGACFWAAIIYVLDQWRNER